MKSSFLYEVWKCIPICVIMFYNTLTLGSFSNSYIIIPEVVLVFYYLLQGRTDKALFYHILFVVCCISSEAIDGSEIDQIYSYSRLKIIGPLNVSDLIILIIAFKSLKNIRLNNKLPLFEKMIKLLLFLLISGFVFGVIGLIFKEYKFSDFVNRPIYLIIVLIYAFCISNNNTDEFQNLMSVNVYRILWSVSVVSTICFLFFNVNISHSGVDNLSIGPDVGYYGIMIIFALFSRNLLWVIIAIALIIPMLVISMSGKAIIVTSLCIIAFMYIYKYQANQFSKMVRFLFPMMICIIVICAVYYLSIIDVSQYTIVKIGEVLSLFYGYSGMESSSQIRFSSFFNILYCGLMSPINLLFGQGFGGYFTDELHLFNGVSIDAGWSSEVIRSGRFTSAHDTFASVTLYHGIIGLYIIYGLCIKYLKMIKKSPLAFAAVIFLGLTFYSNFHFAIAGLLFLYTAEVEYYKSN